MSDAALNRGEISGVSKGSLTSEQVEYHTQMLTRHYGERVAPVSAYCNAFREWRQAIGRKLERIKSEDEADYERNRWQQAFDALNLLEIPIMKSNLLYRLIYAGQSVRTEMCPEHKGRWSGWKWGSYCECMDGSDVTGWLPKHRLEMGELIARFAKSRGQHASFSTHYPASPQYDEKEPTIGSAGGKVVRGKDVTEAAERLAVALREDGFVPEEWQP